MSDGEVYKGSRKPHVFEASHTRNRGSLRDRIGRGNGAEGMQDTREELAEMETTRRPEDNFVFNFFFSIIDTPKELCFGRTVGRRRVRRSAHTKRKEHMRTNTDERKTHAHTHARD